MSDASLPSRPATIDDVLALDPEAGYELINGHIVQKTMGNPDHAHCQANAVGELVPRFSRKPGGAVPGGWWILTECDVRFDDDQLFRPDVVGWRRERVPERPSQRPVTVRPDWVCEILSPSNASNDTVVKLRVYHRTGVPHYWIADPAAGTITVLEWREDAYAHLIAARRGETHRLPPFDAVELDIGVLLGADPA